MPPPDYDTLGRRLHAAYRDAEPIAPLSATHEVATSDAYAVQRAALAPRREAGAQPIGYKLGFTNNRIQQQYGVDEPAHGRLLDDAILDRVVEAGELIQPRVEPELAFVLGDPLEGTVDVATVLAATDRVVPALEVVDSRQGEAITATDAVADNALAARIALAEAGRDPETADWAAESVTLRVDGEAVADGTGREVLGHPARGVAWLAERLDARGERLEPGAVVSTGSLTEAVPITANQRVRATFETLGSVSLRVR